MKCNEITPVNVLCWLRGIVTWERSSSVLGLNGLELNVILVTAVVDM